MKKLENLQITNSFATLGPEFFQLKTPDPVSSPYLVSFSPDAAKLIDLNPEEFKRNGAIEFFSGNKVLFGSKPLAMVYSGHQFGVYNPRLGDGRGLLLGEVSNSRKEKWDVYLKGAGPTRYARGFDGRATLRSSIREYLAGEALAGLGIPTTRSLAVIGTGELVFREIPEPGAVLVRLADSHIRFGNFEYFHYTNQPGKITQLLDYIIHHHFQEIEKEVDKYRLLFHSIIQKTAALIARWQSAGFIHGVMNTDNMTITGTTFDYGPYGFMDKFNPGFTPNHSDTHGRYAFGRQPEIGFWNLGKMSETLSHLLDSTTIEKELESYQSIYNRCYRELMAKKLGLQVMDSEFTQLAGDLLQLLYKNNVDYTNFFRNLSGFPDGPCDVLRKSFKNTEDLERWLVRYGDLIKREGADFEKRKQNMDRANPKFILRSYLMQRAIEKALKESDFSEVDRLRILLQDPFRDRPDIFKRHEINPEYYSSETPESLVEKQLSCSA